LFLFLRLICSVDIFWLFGLVAREQKVRVATVGGGNEWDRFKY
jgi:hypothetical protein